jgi:predicted DNA-binding WGR domain protein
MEGLLSKDKIKLLLKFGPGRLFVNTADEHYKFYHVQVADKKCTVHFGRIGKATRIDSKEFYSNSGAEYYAQDKIKEKLKKGYVEIDKAKIV